MYDVEPIILGRAYEYLLRKFAESSGCAAGEFYTPREVAILISHILNPEKDDEIYDPCCGSAGLLIKCYLQFKNKYRDSPSVTPLRLYSQEILYPAFSMAGINMFIHDMETEIKLGDTMTKPKFTNADGTLRKFDLVSTNPFWNQHLSQDIYENDVYDRFQFGHPPSRSADWGWIQHMYASLKEGGKMTVILDTGAVFRGSGTSRKNRERDIRKKFVDRDLVETVISLPPNLYYNTTAPGIILVINKDKKMKNEILLINGSKLFKKGRAYNVLSDKYIQKIVEVYMEWKEEKGLSKIIKNAKATKNNYI